MRWCSAPKIQATHKQGTTRDILAAFKEHRELSYYDLWFLTGARRDKSARAVKYLRSQGYIFQTVRHSDGHCSPRMATLKYIGNEAELFLTN